MVIEYASNPFSTAHPSFRRADALGRIDNLPVEASVFSFLVIVRKKLVDRLLKLAFAKENHPVGDLPV